MEARMLDNVKDVAGVYTEFMKLKVDHPAIVLMGTRAYDMIAAGAKISDSPGSEHMGSFLGMRVIKSPILPPGFIIFEDADGRVLGIIKMEKEKDAER